MSISVAPAATASRVSSTLIFNDVCPDGNPVATDATATPEPSSAAAATPTCAGYTQTAAQDGISGRVGSGQTALAQRWRTFPGVSDPSSVVRSIIDAARRIPSRLAVVLIDRRPSAAARSSTPTRLTGVRERLMTTQCGSSACTRRPLPEMIASMEYDDDPNARRRSRGEARARAAPPPRRMLALQQSAGNAAVSRMLTRQRNMIQEQYDDARKERETFVAGGKKGPQTYNPSTNNADNYYGGFDVEYDPTKGELLVKLKGAVVFLAGMTLTAAGRAQAVEPSAQTAAAAAAINRLPKAARPAEVAKWTWSSAGGPDSTDETDLLTGFKSSIESAWKEKHPFHCTKNYWEDLGATTKINVEVNKVADARARRPTSTCSSTPTRSRRASSAATRTSAARAGRPGPRSTTS